MSKYKEVNGTGNAWTRCNQIVIENPYNSSQKSIKFREEVVFNIGDTTSSINDGFIGTRFFPSDIVNIRDPSTGLLTGGMTTHQEIYTMLYSLYMQTALERDNQPE